MRAIDFLGVSSPLVNAGIAGCRSMSIWLGRYRSHYVVSVHIVNLRRGKALDVQLEADFGSDSNPLIAETLMFD